VIELKNDSLTIDQDDIDQGISYARLLADNITPFTIISNGTSIRIFDTISRKELTNQTFSEQSGARNIVARVFAIEYIGMDNCVSVQP
jgi:hypothetical protein